MSDDPEGVPVPGSRCPHGFLRPVACPACDRPTYERARPRAERIARGLADDAARPAGALANPYVHAPPPAPGWMCACCGKPVGIVGNWLARVFGTGFHGCDFSRWTRAFNEHRT